MPGINYLLKDLHNDIVGAIIVLRFPPYGSGILTICLMISFCLSLIYLLGLMGVHLVGFGSMAASSAA